ncbi:MAG TPA: Ig-like domain-containing protein, partial [Deinococcales bacterium]|nr:Ig-like domain-containing protein [Deinococcales bacterium]
MKNREPRKTFRKMNHLIRVLRLPVLAALLLLGACGTPKPPPEATATFTAAPELGDHGTWRLSWQTKNAEEVTLDGKSVSANGSRAVTPEEPHEYVLKADNEKKSLTVGPLQVEIDEPESNSLDVDDEVKLTAAVSAPGTDEGIEFSDEVGWTSSDEDVATVTEDGTVTALSAGDVTITADSRQDSGAEHSVDFTVSEDSRTVEFTAEPDPERKHTWLITWDVENAAEITFEGDVVDAKGTHAVSPTKPQTFTLTADGEKRTINLGPLQVKIEDDDLRLSVGDERKLSTTVTAPGTDKNIEFDTGVT